MAIDNLSHFIRRFNICNLEKMKCCSKWWNKNAALYYFEAWYNFVLLEIKYHDFFARKRYKISICPSNMSRTHVTKGVRLRESSVQSSCYEILSWIRTEGGILVSVCWVKTSPSSNTSNCNTDKKKYVNRGLSVADCQHDCTRYSVVRQWNLWYCNINN